MKEKINQSVCHIDIYSMREREKRGENGKRREWQNSSIWDFKKMVTKAGRQ